MSKYIISEQINEEEIKFEPKVKDKEWYLSGIFGQSEVVNRNKRKYLREDMSNAVDRVQHIINSKTKLVGEYQHPKSTEINHENGCIRIDELYMDGNNMMGKAKVLRGMPKGELLIGLLENDIVLPVSTRALGKLSSHNDYTLVNDMELITVDCVSRQSAPDATPDAIFENINWLYEIKAVNEEQAQMMDDFKKTADVKQISEATNTFIKSFFNDYTDYFKQYLKNELNKKYK